MRLGVKSLIFRVTKKYEGEGELPKKWGAWQKRGERCFWGWSIPQSMHTMKLTAVPILIWNFSFSGFVVINCLLMMGEQKYYSKQQQEIMKHLNFRMCIGLNKMHEKKNKNIIFNSWSFFSLTFVKLLLAWILYLCVWLQKKETS